MIIKRRFYSAVSALLAIVLLAFLVSGRKAISPIHQLRIYEVPKRHSEVFHKRFKNHALRIMKKYGFNVVAIWQTTFDDKLEFVYLLEWDDRKAMENAWEQFMADQEWKDIKASTGKQYGTLVERIEDRTLTLTDYSPGKWLKVHRP